MNLNVLFISHSLLMGGGANRSMVQLILELRENHGVKPVVLIPFGRLSHGDQGLANICKQNNIPIERGIIPWFLHSNVWLHRFKYLIMFLYYPILLQKLKKYNLNLIHSNGSVFDLGARLAKSFCIPHVWHLREFGTENVQFKPVFSKNFGKRMYSSCDNFIAISQAIKDSFKEQIPEEKIHCIYNGISSATYNKVAAHKNSRVEFVIVGVITPHKNQLEAILAVDELTKKGIHDFHLNIIGKGDCVYEEQLQDIVNNQKLSDYVSFWGLRNDIPNILAKMDVGLMVSKNEAFGRVTVEYMFQNLAVIASNSGANLELVNDGNTGLTYQLGNYKHLADKMSMLIQSPELLEKLARNGYEFAKDAFNSKKNSDSVFELYCSLNCK